MNDLLENIDDGAITGAHVLDIIERLDSIKKPINLLKKLEMYGIISTELKWFSSYPSGRKQLVKFDQETLKSCDITCDITRFLHLYSRRLLIRYVC